MVGEPKSWAEMVGDGLRETGVLVLVFGLLDKFLFGDGPSFAWTVTVAGVALAGFVGGAMLERARTT